NKVLRLMRHAKREIVELVMTASAPETESPCPAIPSVSVRSAAIGVSKLTGINSEAINARTHRVIAKTPLQYAGGSTCSCFSRGLDIVIPDIRLRRQL